MPRSGFFERALMALGHSTFNLIEVDLSSNTGGDVGVGSGISFLFGIPIGPSTA